MRPSSHWRKQNDDSVDIFGNRKRGGGGDPVRNGSVVTPIPSNLSIIEKYKLLQQKLSSDKQTSITPVPSDAKIEQKKKENEIFRRELDEQVAQLRQAKRLQKMKEQEAERLAQMKLEKELKELQSKHQNEVDNEQNLNAGFLRYRNSHSHIPPPSPKKISVIKHAEPAKAAPISYQEVFEENKERALKQSNHDNIESYKNIFCAFLFYEIKRCVNEYIDITSKNEFVSNNNLSNLDIKSYEIKMLEERLTWKQKISEQELEIKRLRLQMAEQQNDQKTTLQYLLKLQTDFTEQIYAKNQNQNTNIRRPLSGLQRQQALQQQQPQRLSNVSVQSSLSSFNNLVIPSLHHKNVYEQGNITKVPMSPQTPQQSHPQTFLHQVQSQRMQTPQHNIIRPLYHSNVNNVSYIAPVHTVQSVYSQPTKVSNYSSPQIAEDEMSHESSESPLIIPNANYEKNKTQTQPQPSYFSNEELSGNRKQKSHLSTEQTPIIKSAKTPKQQLQQQQIKSRSQSRSTSYRSTPNKRSIIEEESKQESMLFDDAEMELNNSSLFLPINDDDAAEEDDQECNDEDDHLSEKEYFSPVRVENKLLSSSTHFQLLSRPTTAMSPIVHRDSISVSKSENDPFNVHVVVEEEEGKDLDEKSDENEEEEEWKKISDSDRNNVKNLRAAFDELSKEESPIFIFDDEIELKQEVIDKETVKSEENGKEVNEENVIIDNSKDEDEDESEYAEDFEAEISEMEIEAQEIKKDAKKKDVFRLPDLNASINGFQSKVYDVYSSFDDSIMTASVASSSDLSHKSPQRKRCEPIIEWL